MHGQRMTLLVARQVRHGAPRPNFTGHPHKQSEAEAKREIIFIYFILVFGRQQCASRAGGGYCLILGSSFWAVTSPSF